MNSSESPPPGFQELWHRYPWPSAPAHPDVPIVGRNSSGLDLIINALSEVRKPPQIVLEIGAEFGGSTRRFLDHGAYVVSVDPWPDSYRGGSFPELQPLLGRKRAMYDLFLSFCWPYRDRLATVRAGSPEGPLEVRDAGVHVDMVYIDGDHRYDAVLRDLSIGAALFPDALLAGDDWLLKPTAKKYEDMDVPVQLAVRSWAAFNNVHVETEGNSWLLRRERPYNLKPPPPRFAGGSEKDAWTRVERRLKRIEQKVEREPRPTLALALARRARKGLSSLRG